MATRTKSKTLRLNEKAQKALERLMDGHPTSSENDVIQQALIRWAELSLLEDQTMELYEEGLDRWADVLTRLA